MNVYKQKPAVQEDKLDVVPQSTQSESARRTEQKMKESAALFDKLDSEIASEARYGRKKPDAFRIALAYEEWRRSNMLGYGHGYFTQARLKAVKEKYIETAASARERKKGTKEPEEEFVRWHGVNIPGKAQIEQIKRKKEAIAVMAAGPEAVTEFMDRTYLVIGGYMANFDTRQLLDRIDFTLAEPDTFLLYLKYSAPAKFERIVARYKEAQKQWEAVRRTIRGNDVMSEIDQDLYWGLESKAELYSRYLSDAQRFESYIDSGKRTQQKNETELTKKMQEKMAAAPIAEVKPAYTYSRPWEHVPKRPPTVSESISGNVGYKYLHPKFGWVNREVFEAIKSGSDMDYTLLPVIGPITDIKRIIITIKTSDKVPSEVSTIDPGTGKEVKGKVRALPDGKIELTTWNPYKKEIEAGVWEGTWEKRIEERPKAGWIDYTMLVLNVAFLALDVAAVGQVVVRTSMRRAATGKFIRTAEERAVFYDAMSKLKDSEAKRLLNIARDKRSWATVVKELHELAKGGSITDEVLRQYVAREWGGGYTRRALRRMGRGVKDFMGNALAPLSKRRYQQRMVAEFFNEMRNTTRMATVRELAASAAALSIREQRIAARAVFSTMASFSPRSQEALLKIVKKEGGWKKLLKYVAEEAQLSRKANPADPLGESVRRALMRMLPEYKRSLTWGKDFRMFEFFVFSLAVPAATYKPLEMLVEWLGGKIIAKLEKRIQEQERTKQAEELTDLAAKMALEVQGIK
jgi:hypothetical protein